MNIHTEQTAKQPPMLSESDMMRLRRFQETCDDDGSHDIGKVAIEQLVEAGALRATSSGRHRVTTFGSWLLNQPSAASTSPTTLVPGNENAVYAIVFDEADKRLEIVVGEATARAVFARVSDQWNAHLFGKLKSNSRDDRHAHDNIDVAGASLLPAGWTLTLRPDQTIRLASSDGEAWGYQETSGTGTDSEFVYKFLLALATHRKSASTAMTSGQRIQGIMLCIKEYAAVSEGFAESEGAARESWAERLRLRFENIHSSIAALAATSSGQASA